MSQLFEPMATGAQRPLCDVEPRRSDGNGAFHMAERTTSSPPPSDTTAGRPPHRHQSCNPPRPRCRSAGASRDENMPATVNRNRSMSNLRGEIRKAVRFVHDEEEELMMRANNNASAAWQQQSSEFERMRHGAGELASAPDPDDDEVFGLQEQFEMGMKMDEIPILTDEEAAFLMGSTQMMGRSIPRHSSSRTPLGGPLFHKASSFSGVTRGRMVPCSPPVPIPQKQWKRRNSAAVVSSRSSSASFLIPSHDQPYSKTQCEARLWDEYWNYKLSLEARESFEASTNNQRDGDERNKEPLKAKSRTDSEASTDATTQDDQSGGSWEDDEEIDMFDMDDL